MKTFLKFLLLSLFISYFSVAQSQWHISPRLGLNMVPIEENDASGTTHKLGATIGLMTGTTLGNNWDFELGLTFNKRFAHYQYESETNGLDIIQNLLPTQVVDLLGDELFRSYEEVNGYTNYWTVDIPVTLAYRFESGFHLFAGAYFNYMFTIENKEEVTTHIPLLELTDLSGLGIDDNLLSLLPANGTEQTFNTSKNDLNEVDYGIIGGIGYTDKKWILKFAYQYGFNDIRTDNKHVGINNQRALNLSIGYLFHPNVETSKLKPRYDLDLIK